MLFCFCFFEIGVSLCISPDCPGTCFEDQTGLKLTEIHLPLLPECWHLKCVPPPPAHNQGLLRSRKPFPYIRGRRLLKGVVIIVLWTRDCIHVYNVFDLSTPLSKRALIMSMSFLKLLSVVTVSFMFMGVGRAVHWSMGHLPVATHTFKEK